MKIFFLLIFLLSVLVYNNHSFNYIVIFKNKSYNVPERFKVTKIRQLPVLETEPHASISYRTELHFSPPCQNIASNWTVFLFSFLLVFCYVSTHHVSEVCWQFLDLFKLFDLFRVQVLLQLPRRLLV